MNIKHPELIFLLALIPVLIIFLYVTFQKRKEALIQLCSPSRLKSIFPKNSNAKLVLRYSLVVIAFSLIVIAFISPRWGYDWKEVETKGANIYIALDVSRSMLAEDISPSRLTRAKHELSKLTNKLMGDRVGLIIFAGDAFLQSPLTHDYLMIQEWLNEINTNYVPVSGTSIKTALEIAMKGFEHIDSDSKAIIVISDGEEHSEEAENQELLDIAKKVKRKGIKIYSIGVGTNKGAPIKHQGQLIRDKNDSVVISKLNGDLLKQIADISGGYYVRSSTGDFHLDNLYYEHLKKDVSEETLKSGKTKLWYETYQIFAGIALVLLLIELLLTFDLGILALFMSIAKALWSLIRKAIGIKDTTENIFTYAQQKQQEQEKVQKKIAKSKTLSIVLFILVISMSQAQANLLDLELMKGDWDLKKARFMEAKDHYLRVQAQNPHDPRLNYNLGISYYRESNYSQAIHSFQQSTKAARSYLLREKAFYNLGNSFFQSEEYKDAIEAYENALKIIPTDEDAKHNLELAKKKLEEEKQEGDNPGNNNDGDNEDGDNEGNNEGEGEENEEEKDKDKESDKKKPDDKKQDQDDKGQPPPPQPGPNPNQQDNKNNQDKNKGQGGGQQPGGNKPRRSKLSPQEAERLLKQVKEADSGDVQQQRVNSIQVPNRVNINPW